MPRGIEPWTDTDLEQAAGELAPAVEQAVGDFLAAVASRQSLTAAGDGLASVWRGIVERRIRPVAARLWARLYERFAGTRDGAAEAGRDVLDSLAGRTEGFTVRVQRKVDQVLEAARRTDTPAEQAGERVARILAAGDWSGQADTMTRTQAATLLNASTMAAALYREKTQGGRWTKTWTARMDAATRAAHRHADGQTRRLPDPFTVGGATLLFPADPAGPPEQTINCRCRMTVRQEQAADEFASVSQGDAMTSTAHMTLASGRRTSFTLSFSDSLTAAGGDESALKVAADGSWSGPVGLLDAWSADDRMLATPKTGEILTRPMPVPVLVQWRLSTGHDGGELGLMRMDRVWADGQYVMAAGKIDMADPEGERLARKIREKFVRFVSLDVDAATEYRVCLDDEGQPIEGCDWQTAAEAGARVGRVYESWRVMGCTVLAHPAFPDAAISLDDAAVQEPPQLVSQPDSPVSEEGVQQVVVEASTGPAEPSQPDAEAEQGEGLGVDEGIPLLQSEDEEPARDDEEGDSEEGDSEEGEGDGGDSGAMAQQLADDSLTEPAPVDPAGLVAAGLAVKALDTGRVLMLQRALVDDDPAAGMWEFPGGHIESGEDPQTAAVREWAEETGISLPDSAEFTGSWDAPNGKYRLYVAVVPSEDDVPINLDHETRTVLNPDDPDGDQVEVAAWWDIESLPDMPALREETRATPWELLLDAGSPGSAGAPVPADGGDDSGPVGEELAEDGGAVAAGAACVVRDPASATGWAPADCTVEGAVPANAEGTGPADEETDAGAGPAPADAPETGEVEVPGLLLDEDLVPVDAAPPAASPEPGQPAPDDDQDDEELSAAGEELCKDEDGKERLADEQILPEPAAAPGQPATDIGYGCVRWDDTAAAFVPAPCDTPGAVTAGANGGPVQHGCGCGTTPGEPEAELSEEAQQYEAMVASAFEHPSFRPPTEWFRNPKLTEPTLVTISPEGRISGHLALWGVPHVAFQGRNIFAPHSPTNYERFHMRPIHTTEGLVDVGVLAMGTDHARAWQDSMSTVQHYETTGSIVGAIRCGEDAYGIWMAGAVLPDIDPDERLRLSLATFSGDWRNEGRGLDLKAALAVPAGHEGFYTPKNTPRDRNAYALVASGAVTADHVSEARKAFLAELDARVNAAVDRALAQRQEAAQTSARVTAAAERVQAFRARRAAERITVRQRGLGNRMTMIAVLSREYPGVKLAGPRDVSLAKNWVEQQGGLPKHIRKIADHLKRKGFDESHAIATAVNVAKKSCAKTGNGKACAAVAAWERMKAAANAS